METLFDVFQYHSEPAPDPNKPSAAQCLKAIDEAEADDDLNWLVMIQHWIYRNHELFTESEIEKIQSYRTEAAKAVYDRQNSNLL